MKFHKGGQNMKLGKNRKSGKRTIRVDSLPPANRLFQVKNSSWVPKRSRVGRWGTLLRWSINSKQGSKAIKNLPEGIEGKTFPGENWSLCLEGERTIRAFGGNNSLWLLGLRQEQKRPKGFRCNFMSRTVGNTTTFSYNSSERKDAASLAISKGDVGLKIWETVVYGEIKDVKHQKG